ncbi:MAG: type I-E CRISPR-associated protein Cse1/CasA [Clostridiales bacterium]|nr:type I-E CRISPR-associated protein Cse1/CasA [Clostridiales bacterium]
MQEKEFNLLYEPWIRVMDNDCSVKEISLVQAIVDAHKYKGLCGDICTQDPPIMRLLLAVLHAVFERVDEDGNDYPVEDYDGAINRWKELWQLKRFPEKPVKDYLEKYKERFWLFHPERPFFQVPAAKRGTEYKAYKLNGAISESSNKIRLFSDRKGEEKNILTYGEAARWLLYVNAFDDTSAKPTKEGKAGSDDKLPSPGAGWLGKLGFVYISGENLYETLMYNLTLLKNGEENWESCTPVWELDKPREKERTEIPLPNDAAKLLTLQSRRLILDREGEQVTGFHLLGGDFFPKENAFSEQMTVWVGIKDKKGNVNDYQPKRHDKSKQMWRDFSAYATCKEGRHMPGVVRWNNLLQSASIVNGNTSVNLNIASVQYGDKDFFVTDQFADSLRIHANILSNAGEIYQMCILDEIDRCDKISGFLSTLAKELFLASGGDPKKVEKWDSPVLSAAKESFFSKIDMPFRQWLAGLDACDTHKTRENKILLWRERSEKIAYDLAKQMVDDAGPTAFVGKTVSDKNGNERFYSTSMAYNNYYRKMKELQEGR